MLTIVVPAVEGWDEQKEEFVSLPPQVLNLEHSLLSITKWEAKWHKPFLAKTKKTEAETLDYIRCMTLDKGVSSDVYLRLGAANLRKIHAYIDEKQTATTIKELPGGKKSSSFITNELIYYWMVSYNIPFDPCQKWHLSRLLTLIQVCDEKNRPQKKQSKQATMAQNAALNAARRKRAHSKG